MAATSDTGRGQKVLAAAAALRNVRLEMVATLVADLLATDAWRSYTLPTGERYTWQAAEFDLFLSAVELDPHLVEQAVRTSGDRALLLQLTAAADPGGGRRESVAAPLMISAPAICAC